MFIESLLLLSFNEVRDNETLSKGRTSELVDIFRVYSIPYDDIILIDVFIGNNIGDDIIYISYRGLWQEIL